MEDHTSIPKKALNIQLKVGHHLSGSETTFQWRFSGGLMKAQHRMLSEYLSDFLGGPDQASRL